MGEADPSLYVVGVDDLVHGVEVLVHLGDLHVLNRLARVVLGVGLHGPPKQRVAQLKGCLLYTSPSPRDRQKSRMPSSA